ncbi:hypothetical protein HK097_000641 [Rhizophlyctis rosea]|uniref:CAP-Gly domain-containing protein n=1 Tax=Rhizophlyctis rosea TaxID=64517 RepID=A0AAD5S6I0_9FUNG|nr:hypothetical protein HK097_000641 [Rhizophlyctis rosea]
MTITESIGPLADSQEADRIGSRIEVDGHFGSIRFRGAVPAESNTDWYGVEWDDPTRGKHSGTFKGVTYFTTREPTAGSFLKTCSKNIHFARGFLQALSEKYLVQLSDSVVRLGGDGKEVETVGWEKIVKKQTQLSRLKEVGLAGLNIGFHDGAPGEITTTCPSITDLDLSRNLFSSLSDVAKICKELPNLQSLRISFNRFKPLTADSAQEDFPSAFPNLQAITLFGTHITWPELTILSPYLPALTDLHFGFNSLSTFQTPTLITSFKTITLLNLESNSLSSWSEISLLSALPTLQTLFLQNNSLPSIDAPKPIDFPSLKTLNLNTNKISSWQSIHNLNAFPSLCELRFKFNPVLSEIPPTDVHYILIARIGNLTILNGSTITPRNRIDCELFYLGHCAQSRKTLSDADFDSQHPRYKDLVKLHGEPNLAPKSATSTALKDRLLVLTLVCAAKGKSVEKRLPGTMSVRVLRATVGRLFGIRGAVRVRAVSGADGREVELEDEMREVGFYGVESGDRIVVEV